MPCEFETIADNMRGTYVILGIMIIGLGLASIEKVRFDWKFISVLLSAKFIAMPLAMMMLIELDQTYFQLFNEQIYRVLLLLAIVPPASNIIIFASIHKCYPGETSTAVLVGTLIALVYVPAAIILLI